MSTIGDAVRAVKDALLLAEDVRRLGDSMKSAALELREHDRRITRLEAQWDTALQLSTRQTSKRLAKGSNDNDTKRSRLIRGSLAPGWRGD